MRASRLVALACASLAASAAPTSEISLKFDKECVTEAKLRFTDAIAAREYIETVPKVTGKCENVRVLIWYKVKEVARCKSTDGSVVVGAPLGELFEEQLAQLNHTGDVIIRTATFFFTAEGSGDCHKSRISGTSVGFEECTDRTRTPYAMKSRRMGSGVFFTPSKIYPGIKFADLAVKASFGKDCGIRGDAIEAELLFEVKLGLESTVGVKDVTIAFPGQPDCAPRGCDSIVGTKGVKACLDNARAVTACKQAVYTRTYLHLGSNQYDPDVRGKLYLDMDTILADDEALDFDDKRTVITAVKFGQKSMDDWCSDTVLGLTKSCSHAPSVKSTLREIPARRFTFIGEEAFAAEATHYTMTTTCNSTSSDGGHEVTLKTEFTIPHNIAASEVAASETAASEVAPSASRRASGSFARLQVGGLLTAAALILGLKSL